MTLPMVLPLVLRRAGRAFWRPKGNVRGSSADPRSSPLDTRFAAASRLSGSYRRALGARKMCKQPFAFSARRRRRQAGNGAAPNQVWIVAAEVVQEPLTITPFLFPGQPPQKPAHEQHKNQDRERNMDRAGEHRRYRQGPYRNCQAMVHNRIVEAPAKQIDSPPENHQVISQRPGRRQERRGDQQRSRRGRRRTPSARPSKR